jgi:hypothetical protein
MFKILDMERRGLDGKPEKAHNIMLICAAIYNRQLFYEEQAVVDQDED